MISSLQHVPELPKNLARLEAYLKMQETSLDTLTNQFHHVSYNLQFQIQTLASKSAKMNN